MEEHVKKEILTQLLNRIVSIADKELQEKGWYGKLPDVWVTYDETYDMFCDDSTWDIIERYELFQLTEQQRDLVAKLYDEYEKYHKNLPSLEDERPYILADPKWEEVRELAREVLRAFNHTTRHRCFQDK